MVYKYGRTIIIGIVCGIVLLILNILYSYSNIKLNDIAVSSGPGLNWDILIYAVPTLADINSLLTVLIFVVFGILAGKYTLNFLDDRKETFRLGGMAGAIAAIILIVGTLIYQIVTSDISTNWVTQSLLSKHIIEMTFVSLPIGIIKGAILVSLGMFTYVSLKKY